MPSAESRSTIIDLQAHRYSSAKLESKYIRSNGLLVIPVMGPAGTAPVVARVHAPFGLREAEFEYVKSGSPAVFPAPEDTESGDTILSSEITIPSPSAISGGLPQYGIRGSYLYVQPLDGRGSQSEFPLDDHPYPNPAMFVGDRDITPALPYDIDQAVDGIWNRKVVDSSQLCSYGMVK